MRPRLLPPIPSLALCGLLALTAAGFAQLLRHQVDISPLRGSAANSQSPAPEDRSLPDWDAPDPATLTAIVERPLFIEGRTMPGDIVADVAPEPLEQAPEPVIEEVAPPPPPPLDYGLVGVMIAGGEKKALLAHTATGVQVWVGLFDKLASWSVTEIASNRVVLTYKDVTRKLALYPTD
ncbi:hypothetical protein [Breoghania sp. L-A4]|uniref:hypothetical protein n=1 Tax=Breoghania sp. L-A4 TaxID=2304600 RepID=UPI000E35F880|nr:hypothetical protein [Breoghania sp. L-A4]AXS39161.1 hypothetical protein D1F64_02700 [Breoghania sp. L-A4]